MQFKEREIERNNKEREGDRQKQYNYAIKREREKQYIDREKVDKHFTMTIE